MLLGVSAVERTHLFNSNIATRAVLCNVSQVHTGVAMSAGFVLQASLRSLPLPFFGTVPLQTFSAERSSQLSGLYPLRI